MQPDRYQLRAQSAVDWLTIEQAADVVQVSPSTIRRAIRNLGLPASAVGGRGTWRIARGELDEWMRGRSNVAREARCGPRAALPGLAATRDTPRTRRGPKKGLLVLPPERA